MITKDHWEKVGLFHHHGINLPLSALWSQNSCGIGEFFDIIPLFDWCKTLGFDCIQLLPLSDINDDVSPYNPISSCALDPVYLSLRALPHLDQELITDLKEFDPLILTPRVHPLAVKIRKMRWLKKYFKKTFKKTAAYREFFKKHQSWLEIYALFKVYRNEYGSGWIHWPKEKQSFQIDHDKHSEMEFYSFLQFLCFQQLESVKQTATEKGILLKGDIPVLVSPDSADVWAYRSRFNLSLEAGAPPDFYTPQGQHWGFPLFDWDEMEKLGFIWWKERLKSIESLFHLYRVDHVLGFFRMWGIEKGKLPTEGMFVPINPTLWEPRGREILQMIVQSSPLLPMAEDLGTTSRESYVFDALKEMGICGVKLIWQERKWSADRSFIPFNEYEKFSMTTVSTHDSPRLKGWWKKPELGAPFAKMKGWDYSSDLSFDHHMEILRDTHQSSSLFHINLLQEYLALFPELVWPTLKEERINIPGTLGPDNWTYRFKKSVEEILSHQPLQQAIRSVLTP